MNRRAGYTVAMCRGLDAAARRCERAAAFDIIPNDNPKEREGHDGRIRTLNRRTWLVVRGNDVIDEVRTKREAVARVAREVARRAS